MLIKCILADLKVEYHTLYEYAQQLFTDYLAEFEEADLIINVAESDIDFERQLDKTIPVARKSRTVEKTTVFRMFAERLPKFDGSLLHSCCFNVGEKGIALSAVSGTGKSTHMSLWQQLVGDKLTIINGDKPFLRFIDGELYAYGSPWMGKEGFGCNKNTLLTDICLIERSDINITEPMSKTDGIMLLMQQIYMPFDPQMRLKTIELVYKIAEKVNFWKIKCNMEIEAAEVAYNAIINGNTK